MIKIVGFQLGHDASYCILENGVPILCEEMERVTRLKLQPGDGLQFFFSRCDKYDDLKYFTFGNWGQRKVRGVKNYDMDMVSDIKMKKIIAENNGAFYEFGHHTSHAANAFYTSNFDEALIITIDGGGYESSRMKTAFTISKGINNRIDKIITIDSHELNLGWMWYCATADIFGLSNDYPKGDQAGTVMAMATFGEPKYVDLFTGYPPSNLEKLKKIASTSEQEKFNLAASLQEYTESTFKTVVSSYFKGYENICFSGGVSLNCVMMGKIKKWFPEVKNIFCDPVPFDAGLALGSARYLWHHILGNPRIKDDVQNMSPFLGKKYLKEDIEKEIKSFEDNVKVINVSDEEVLDKVNQEKIISVFGGGSESGRRALGNRSILADPRSAEMKKMINEMVKHRQWFRPLAPSILEEKIGEWFEDPILSPYMSFALKFKEKMKSKVPAVVHYDGTGRLQTVNKGLNPWFHGFLEKWQSLSGVPILINTSFNDNEPIVETPEDALKCFLRTNIDYLYFFDYGILAAKS